MRSKTPLPTSPNGGFLCSNQSLTYCRTNCKMNKTMFYLTKYIENSSFLQMLAMIVLILIIVFGTIRIKLSKLSPTVWHSHVYLSEYKRHYDCHRQLWENSWKWNGRRWSKLEETEIKNISNWVTQCMYDATRKLIHGQDFYHMVWYNKN